MKIFLFLFFVSSLGFSQNTPVTEHFLSSLAPGQSFSLESKSLKFIEVISDSRCPKGTTCIWAGEAKVLVEFSKNGKLLEKKVIALGQAENLPADLFGDSSFLISKLRLTPYPSISEKTPLADYRLMMEVRNGKDI